MNPITAGHWRRWWGWVIGRREATRSGERYRRALLTTLASGVARAGGLLSMLVLVPVLYRHLGEERLGLWMTLNSLTILIGFADLGMGTGLMTTVAKAEGSGREDLARGAISSCFFVLLGLAVGLGAVFAAVLPRIGWEAVLKTSAAVSHGELVGAMAAFGVATLGGLPFSIVERVQAGNQEGFASQLWQGAATVVSLVAVLSAVAAGMGLAGILWAGLGSKTLMLAANWFVYFRGQRPGLCPRWIACERKTAAEMMRLGLVFLWLNILAFNWWLVDPIIITRTLGPAEVAGYGAMQRLFAVALVAQYLVMPLWAPFGEALARGDVGWVRRALKRSLMLTLSLTAVLGLGLVLFGQPLTRVWLRSAYVPGTSLLIGMACLNVLLIVAWNLSGVLVHGSYLRRQAGLYTVAAGLALMLKIALVRWWGLPGVVWASVIAFGAVYTPMAFRLVRLAVSGPGSETKGTGERRGGDGEGVAR